MTRTDAEVAVAAASAGAAEVRSRYGGPLTRYAKSATDFATEADVEAERAILAVIRSERPDDAFLGEELGEEPGRSQKAATGRRWLVDPLCGTLNYAVTTPLVAVNVALHDATGRALAAASVDPIADEVFWTDGSAAHLRAGGRDVPLVPSAASRLVDVNLDWVYPEPGRLRPGALLGHPDFAARYGGRVLSTTLAVAWVAAGRRAGYVTDGAFVDNVHFAAGLALCRAAGCVVTDLRGAPLDTAGGGGLVVAADAATHADLVALVEASSR